MTVPRLNTALAGPLPDLERQLLASQPDIERWLRGQWQDHAAPFYCSVDLRNSGFKIAPVDTNLFPGGFNNLNPEFHPLCVQAAMSALEKVCPDARGCVLVPENHTRNTFYLQNVATIAKILRHAGMNVRIGSMLPEIDKPTEIALPDGSQLKLEPRQRKGNRPFVAHFDPCVRLCTPAGRCAASPITSRLIARWRKNSARRWASTHGSSTRISSAAARS